MAGRQPQSSSVSIAPAEDYLKPVGSHASNSSLSSAVTLTKPAGASAIMMQAITQNVRYRLDAGTPTASLGFQLAAGDYILLPVPGDDVRVIEETASAVLQYQWLA